MVNIPNQVEDSTEETENQQETEQALSLESILSELNKLPQDQDDQQFLEIKDVYEFLNNYRGKQLSDYIGYLALLKKDTLAACLQFVNSEHFSLWKNTIDFLMDDTNFSEAEFSYDENGKRSLDGRKHILGLYNCVLNSTREEYKDALKEIILPLFAERAMQMRRILAENNNQRAREFKEISDRLSKEESVIRLEYLKATRKVIETEYYNLQENSQQQSLESLNMAEDAFTAYEHLTGLLKEKLGENAGEQQIFDLLSHEARFFGFRGPDTIIHKPIEWLSHIRRDIASYRDSQNSEVFDSIDESINAINENLQSPGLDYHIRTDNLGTETQETNQETGDTATRDSGQRIRRRTTESTGQETGNRTTEDSGQRTNRSQRRITGTTTNTTESPDEPMYQNRFRISDIFNATANLLGEAAQYCLEINPSLEQLCNIHRSTRTKPQLSNEQKDGLAANISNLQGPLEKFLQQGGLEGLNLDYYNVLFEIANENYSDDIKANAFDKSKRVLYRSSIISMQKAIAGFYMQNNTEASSSNVLAIQLFNEYLDGIEEAATQSQRYRLEHGHVDEIAEKLVWNQIVYLKASENESHKALAERIKGIYNNNQLSAKDKLRRTYRLLLQYSESQLSSLARQQPALNEQSQQQYQQNMEQQLQQLLQQLQQQQADEPNARMAA